MTEQDPETPSAELDLSDFKVLIVEDYHFIAEILSLSLKEMGVGDVITADSGAKAQNKILALNNLENDHNIDVVLLDWLMPEMDGRTLIKWIREHKSDTIRFLPVIICSAYTSETLVMQSRDLGANEVIVKPVSAKEVARRVQHVINFPRPYVKSKTFFGPDRRRQDKPFEGEDQRKIKPKDMKVNHEHK